MAIRFNRLLRPGHAVTFSRFSADSSVRAMDACRTRAATAKLGSMHNT